MQLIIHAGITVFRGSKKTLQVTISMYITAQLKYLYHQFAAEPEHMG